MFRSFIYCNTHKLYEYMSVLKGKKEIKVKNITERTEHSIHGKPKYEDDNIRYTSNTVGEVSENLLYDYNEFENLLNVNKEYFFDFMECNETNSIEIIENSSLIKFQSTLTIPQEFDMIHILEKMKPYIIDTASNGMGDIEKTAIQEFFFTNGMKIPVFFIIQNIILYGKLSSEYLIAKYNDLEEYESTEVTILAKIISKKNIETSTIIYDPLKDFIQLNRTIRRSIENTRPKELATISIDRSYINIEIIAVYQ